MNQKRAEQTTESVSHPNTHRLNLGGHPEFSPMGNGENRGAGTELLGTAHNLPFDSSIVTWEELGKMHEGSTPFPMTDTVEYFTGAGASSCGGLLILKSSLPTAPYSLPIADTLCFHDFSFCLPSHTFQKISTSQSVFHSLNYVPLARSYSISC